MWPINRARLHMIIAFFIVIFSLVAIALVIVERELDPASTVVRLAKNPLFISAGTILVIGVFYFVLSYLRSTTASFVYEIEKRRNFLNNGELDRDIGDLYGRVIDLEDLVSSTKNWNINIEEEEKQRLLNRLQEKVEENLHENILNIIENEYGEKVENKVIIENLERQFLKIERRISFEIDSLNGRGNLNLTIGAVTTLIAIGILTTSIFFNTAPSDPKELIVFLLPRITLSIFIEIFSFFFLRLYSAGLKDIKYYQNELTNIEAKSVALRQAIATKDQPAITDILRNLVNTDRNLILKKEQKPIISNDSNYELHKLKEILSNILDILKNHKN